MSFFRRDEEPTPAPATTRRPGPPPAGEPQAAVTRIAPGTRITGEVSGSTELHVDGEIDGRVRVDGRVVVGQPGGVRGEIHARTVMVAGRVEGPVRGSERVEVGGSGRLEGDIAAPRVTIAEGAFFKGQVEMGGRDERASRPVPGPTGGPGAERGPVGGGAKEPAGAPGAGPREGGPGTGAPGTGGPGGGGGTA